MFYLKAGFHMIADDRRPYLHSLEKMKEDGTYEEAEQESLDLPNSLQIFLAIKTVSGS